MNNILNNLGLCNKANGLISGEDAVKSGIKEGNVCYIFLAKDAGINTKKTILDKSKFYSIDVNMDYYSCDLSKAVGKNNRMVIGIVDQRFLKILKK